VTSITKTEFQYGDHTVTIETNEIARQASGAVMISMGETVVMVTAVGIKEASAYRQLPGTDLLGR